MSMHMLLALMMVFVGGAFAEPSLRLVDAYVPPAKVGENPVLSGLLVNDGSLTVVVRGFATDVARAVVVSTYSKNMVTELLQESPVPFVAVPAGKAVVLAAGVLDVRLLGVSRDLEAGTEVPVQLTFDDGYVRTVRVRVGAKD